MEKETSVISRYVYTVIVLFVIWLFFVSTLKPQEVLAGVVFSLIIAAFTYPIFTRAGLMNFHPKRVAYAIVYVPYFLWAMIMANLDVAYRVLHPKRPIRPGIVRCRTILKSDTGRLGLANSITLTPGTITLDVKGEDYFIHWIWVQDDVIRAKDDEESIRAASRHITRPFEKFLKVIFE